MTPLDATTDGRDLQPSRRTRRHRLMRPVRARLAEGTWDGLCVNVSAGGAALQLRAGLRIGERIELTLEFAEARAAEVAAEVVHAATTSPGLYGVRFVTLPQQALAAIHLALSRAAQEHPLVEPQFVHL